ncbi:hypothetical protein [Streptomyces sp. NPDC007088]|uniref:GP88 family protein n=1 Tax=Streptomyces sp. NPDC007088 TaxID=3364773 RepID=UPI0036976B41
MWRSWTGPAPRGTSPPSQRDSVQIVAQPTPPPSHRRDRIPDPAVRRPRRARALAWHRDSTVARGRAVSPTASCTAHHPLRNPWTRGVPHHGHRLAPLAERRIPSPGRTEPARQLHANFKFVYTRGGKEDFLIDPSRDRDADVFPTLADLDAAGYSSQAASDLLAVHGPPRVGMAANRYRKDLTASFGELQRRQDAETAARRASQQSKARASR